MADTPTTRRREIVLRRDPYEQGSIRLGVKTVAASGTVKCAGTQVTVSEGHPWPPPKGSKFKDVGGNFTTTRYHMSDSRGNDSVAQPIYYVTGKGSLGRTFFHRGPIYPSSDFGNSFAFPASGASSDAELDALGATAINITKPTNSVAELSTALGELFREGLPRAPGSQTWRERTHLARNSGSEYLNVVFGWLPLIADIKDTSYAVKHADELLAQYRRDSGRIVRRRYEFPLIRETVVHPDLTGQNVYPVIPYNSIANLNGGTLSRQSEKTVKRWFSGAFSYYLPTGDSFGDRFRRYASEADRLFGLTLDPETIWNLAPWTWAIDWFSNTGDVISNLSDMATDGLVLRYGYMMEKSTVTTTYSLRNHGINTVPDPLTASLTTVTKKRRRATPYGFGLTFDGLSTRQKAILAALGISRWG